MALSSFAHRRCLAGSWNPHRGHHESNSPPGPYAYFLRQSPGHHDHVSGRGLTEYSEEGGPEKPMTDQIKANLSRMLDEHKAIVIALDDLGRAASHQRLEPSGQRGEYT